jgi:hypothetical protein
MRKFTITITERFVPSNGTWMYATSSEDAAEGLNWASRFYSGSDLRQRAAAAIELHDGDVITATRNVYSSDEDGIDRLVRTEPIRGVVSTKIVRRDDGTAIGQPLVSINADRATALGPYVALRSYVINGCSNVLSNIEVVA